jgi:hypothetical protein
VLLSGQKRTLGLLATITLEVLPFHTHSTFSALLPFFKCILEVVFPWECSTLPASLPRSPLLLQNDGLLVLFLIWETEESRVGSDDSHVSLGQIFPGEKGSVRRCVVVMQQLVLLSSNFGAKQSLQDVSIVFGLLWRIPYEQSLWY